MSAIQRAFTKWEFHETQELGYMLPIAAQGWRAATGRALRAVEQVEDSADASVIRVIHPYVISGMERACAEIRRLIQEDETL